MKTGDLVRIFNKRSHPVYSTGILLKRTYLAYENRFSKWKVLKSDGCLVVVYESQLRMFNDKSW
jgi:hypothetical protein